MADLKLAFDILARDKASREIDRVGNALDRTGKKGAGFSRTIHAALLGATSSIVGGAVAAVKAAGDYEQSLTSLVTGAGESQKNIKLVGQGMLDLAGKVGIGANDLARGMYLIESSGKHGADGLLVLKAAAEGARIGSADMATVADGLTTALNDYRLPASAAAKVTSQLVATVAAGKTHMEDLAGALATVLPAASAAHVGLTQVLGAMATMTANGTPAADAATYLKQTIVQLANPTAKAAKEMKALGLNSIDISKNLGKRGLTGTLDLLTTAIARHMGPAGTVLIETLKKSAKSTKGFHAELAKLPPEQQTYIAALAKMVGGSKSMQAALELTGGSAATFASNVKTISATTAEAGGHVKGFALTQKDFKTQLENVTAEIKTLTIEVGDKLLPPLETFLTGMQNGTGVGGAFASTLKGLGDDAQTAWHVAEPIFTFIGDHPTLFKEVAKDAALLAVALKAMSVIRKLPSLGGLGGSKIGGLGGTVASLAKPLPVFVTNEGFGGGGGGLPLPGGTKTGGGKVGKLGKIAATGAAVAGQLTFAADIILVPKAIASLKRNFGFSFDLSVNDAVHKFQHDLTSAEPEIRAGLKKHLAQVEAGVAEAARTGNTGLLQKALKEAYADANAAYAASAAKGTKKTVESFVDSYRKGASKAALAAAAAAEAGQRKQFATLNAQEETENRNRITAGTRAGGLIAAATAAPILHGAKITGAQAAKDLNLLIGGAMVDIDHKSAHPKVTIAGGAFAALTQIIAKFREINGQHYKSYVDITAKFSGFNRPSSSRDGSNGPARAGGGPVLAGQGYWVGEKEREWFQPDTSGRIYNQKQLAALATTSSTPTTYNVTVNNPVPEPAANLPRALSTMTYLLGSA